MAQHQHETDTDGEYDDKLGDLRNSYFHGNPGSIAALQHDGGKRRDNGETEVISWRIRSGPAVPRRR